MGQFYSQRPRVYAEVEKMPALGMVMAVKGGKHITIFTRKRTAPGAGRLEVKEAFTGCARKTIGEPNRLKRNVEIKKCMEAKGLKTGVYHRKSRAKPGSPLFGKVYEVKAGVTRKAK